MGLENKTPTPPSIEKLADAVIEMKEERDGIAKVLWRAQVDGRCRHCKRVLVWHRIVVGKGLCFECELVEDARDEFLQKRRPL